MKRRHRGVSAVEFALVLPILIVVLFGVIDFGRAFWLRSKLQTAAEDAGRYAMTHTGLSNSQIETYLRGRTGGYVDLAAVTVTINSDVDGGVTFLTIIAQTTLAVGGPLNILPFVLQGRTRVPRAT
jgi:Flp pilus assembly protein TadG